MRGKPNLKTLRVLNKHRRAEANKTRRHVRTLDRRDRRMRLLQGAIGGQLVADAAVELDIAGDVLPEPAPPLPPAPFMDPLEDVALDREVNAGEAAAILEVAAIQADNPSVLIQAIRNMRETMRRLDRRNVARFTIKQLVILFISLVTYYAISFPFHAAPRHASFFDATAALLSHYSIASDVAVRIGLLPVSLSGPLASASYAVKMVGKTVRNYNVLTGVFPNSGNDAASRALNVLNYHPTIGSYLTYARLGGVGAGAVASLAEGKSVLDTTMEVLGDLGKTSANLALSLGKRFAPVNSKKIIFDA